MEENHQEARETLFSLLDSHSRLQQPQFHRLLLMLLQSMRWRTLVSRDECEEVGARGAGLCRGGRRAGPAAGAQGLTSVSCVPRSMPSIPICGFGAGTGVGSCVPDLQPRPEQAKAWGGKWGPGCSSAYVLGIPELRLDLSHPNRHSPEPSSGPQYHRVASLE